MRYVWLVGTFFLVLILLGAWIAVTSTRPPAPSGRVEYVLLQRLDAQAADGEAARGELRQDLVAVRRRLREARADRDVAYRRLWSLRGLMRVIYDRHGSNWPSIYAVWPPRPTSAGLAEGR